MKVFRWKMEKKLQREITKWEDRYVSFLGAHQYLIIPYREQGIIERERKRQEQYVRHMRLRLQKEELEEQLRVMDR